MGEKAGAAERTFQSGLNCAQSMVAAFASELPAEAEGAIRAAAALGGGIARTGQMCGAVSGALLVIGLRHGSAEPDRDAEERVYARSQEFLRRFQERHGTMSCQELIGCDLSTEAGRAFAREHQLHSVVCSLLVRDAARILEEMIAAED